MIKVGFIGIGIMGKSMVLNLLKAGFEVDVYSRTKSKADECVAEGADGNYFDMLNYAVFYLIKEMENEEK